MTAQEQTPTSSAPADDVAGAALFSRALHGAVEPWVLIKAVRDGDGAIVDFVFRDANRAASDRALPREIDADSSVAQTMPDMVRSGLLDRCARLVETGEPLILDDFLYRPLTRQGDIGRRHRYEIRAVRVAADYLSVTWRDVSDRYESARKVAESEEHYRLLAENATDVVVHVRDQIIVWVSPSVQDSFGAPPSFWIGQSIAKFLVLDDMPVFADILDHTATGQTTVRRLRVRDFTGVAHWTEIHAQLFYDAAGYPDGRTASLRVIDTEVAAEKALEGARREQAQADARYRKLIANSVVPTALHDPDGRFVAVNQAICDYYGYDAATLLTMTWQELTAPEDLEQDLAAEAEIVAGRSDSYRKSKQYIHADGHRIWGDLSLSSMRTPDGAVENLICQIVDITAAMRARQRLLASEELNRVLAQDLQSELNSAAHYLRSALPDDLTGPVSADGRYLPSRILGGDFFDFLWVDDDHLIAYLLDVSGHGVQSALVAVSAHNMLRSSLLPTGALLHPSQVLGTLNRNFAMDQHDGNYVTIWYGVYQMSTRTLRYAGAGHPPAVLITGDQVVQLASQSPPAGMFEDTVFPATVVPIAPGSQLLIYSDGAYELTQPGGGPWLYAQFVDVCTRLAGLPGWSLDGLVSDLLSHSATGSFEDDCSLVRLKFE